MSAYPLRAGLPPVPARMARLSRDSRGYPVPWFVNWYNGVPDFRVADGAKWRNAVRFHHCWICGEHLGVLKTYVLGPINTVSRLTSEPACHWDCAEFAARACPFLILPKAQYRNANLPANVRLPPGDLITRNPGVCALWTASRFRLIPMTDQRRLIGVGDPKHVEWYAQGATATRAQVLESLDEGLPYLYRSAASNGDRIGGLVRLENDYARMVQYLPTDGEAKS
jgi:hypothetical protein